MAKQKYTLSKKHEYMIEKCCEIPSIDEIKGDGFMRTVPTNFRYNTEDILLMILENLTKGTQQENITKEIIEKARAVFDYYSDEEV